MSAQEEAQAWVEELERCLVSLDRERAELAARLAEAIAAGRQPTDLTAEPLIRHVDLPLDWNDQRALLIRGLLSLRLEYQGLGTPAVFFQASMSSRWAWTCARLKRAVLQNPE
jgi:hypothetical protein